MDPTFASCLVFETEVISPEVEARFLSRLAAPLDCPHAKWTQLKRRKLILAGACPPAPGQAEASAETNMSSLPSWIIDPELLASVNKRLPSHIPPFSGNVCGCGTEQQQQQQQQPSSTKLNVLINEYDAPHGIMLHTDGPAYSPAVCIISMASSVPLVFTPSANAEEMDSLRKLVVQSQPQASSGGGLYDDDEDDDDEDSLPEWAIRAAEWTKLEAVSDLLVKSETHNLAAVSSDRLTDGLSDLRLASPGSFAVLLPPRSLVIFSGALYERFLHGIVEPSFVDVIPRSKLANFDALVAAKFFAETIDASTKPVGEFKSLVSSIVKAKQDRAKPAEPTRPAGALLVTRKTPAGDAVEDALIVNVRDKTRVSLTYRRIL